MGIITCTGGSDSSNGVLIRKLERMGKRTVTEAEADVEVDQSMCCM